jgi:hypothetical protein
LISAELKTGWDGEPVLNRLLIYTFPFLLLVMEWLLRISLQVDSKEFVAPTIAAAALGLLLPLTGRKKRYFQLKKVTRVQLEALKVDLVPRSERILIEIVWIAVLVSLIVWASCLVFACKPDDNPVRIAPVYYGLVSYFVAVVFSEIKEIV